MLIGPRGDIVWLCFPRWNDQAILTTLLGGAGEYTTSPTGVYVWGGSYETGTLIWRSRWVTHQGIVECREALAYPGDPGMAVLLRSVTAVDGPASLRVWLDLRHGEGRRAGCTARMTAGLAGSAVPASVGLVGRRPPSEAGPTAGRGSCSAWHCPRAGAAISCLRSPTGPSAARRVPRHRSRRRRSRGGDAPCQRRILADGPELRPAYTRSGGIVPEESRLGLPGYSGGSPDVVSNRVTKQFQLDALGEALQLFAAAGEAGRLDPDAEHATETAVAAIGRRWRDPEAGMWELEDRFWTQSRLSCVAGLRAAAAIPPRAAGGGVAGTGGRGAAETTRRCLAPDGRWRRAADDPRLDAGLLLAPIRGALPPADPRSQATLAGYLSGLTEDGYAYRFRQDCRPLHAAEGAFLFCGYIVALALQQQGDSVAAARWFERNRAACGPTRPVLRGVRRGAAPVARQPAPGVRPCDHA